MNINNKAEKQSINLIHFNAPTSFCVKNRKNPPINRQFNNMFSVNYNTAQEYTSRSFADCSDILYSIKRTTKDSFYKMYNNYNNKQHKTNHSQNIQPPLKFSNKKINIILLGPHKSGKTLLINSLCNTTNVNVINSSYSIGILKEIFEQHRYETSPILEKYIFNISHMFMDLDISDTSGSQVYMSLLKNVCKNIDISLLIFDVDYDNIKEFTNFYKIAKHISSQMVIIIINTTKYKSNIFIKMLELFCVNNNLFHITVNITTDIEIILQTIRSFMFSASEFNLILNNTLSK